jgi:predicted DNA-binding transcriptional regulator AlpA
MGDNANERWLSRRDLAERYGLPVKTLAQWASKGTGPRYARMGRHVRYRLSDVIDWETARFDDLQGATELSAPTNHTVEGDADAVTGDAHVRSVRNFR